MHSMMKYGMAFALAFVFSVSLAVANESAARISEREASEAALKKTGRGAVLGIEAGQENGRALYSLLIVDEGTRFDVQVDAVSGEIVKYAQRDVRSARSLPRGMVGRSALLNSEDAEPAALGVSGGGIVVRSDLESRSGGRSVYEVEIVNSDRKFCVEVDANSGDVVSYEEQLIRGSAPVTLVSR